MKTKRSDWIDLCGFAFLVLEIAVVVWAFGPNLFPGV